MKLAILLGVVVLGGCNSSSGGGSSSAASDVTSSPSAETPMMPVAPGEIIAPRGDETNPSAYLATQVPYRLFGTNKGDGVVGAAAVIADTKTWATKTYAVGDALGRGLVVEAIGEHTVTLRSSIGSVVLTAGASTPIRFIAHKLDLAVTSLGKMTYRVNLAAAQKLPTTAPAVDEVQVYGETVLRLGPVTPDTLFAQADFQEGDLLATLDGAPVGSMARLAQALTTGPGSISVRLVRKGVAYERTYLEN